MAEVSEGKLLVAAGVVKITMKIESGDFHAWQ